MSSSATTQSLRSTIFLRIAPLAGLILLAIVAVSNYRVSQTLRDEVQERVDTSAKHAAQQVEIKLAAIIDACQAVAANDLVVNGIVDIDHRNSTLRSYFRSLRLPGPKSQQTSMADYRGRLIASTAKDSPSYVDVAWYEDVMGGGQFVGAEGTTLTVAVPVLYGNRAEAVIVSTFDLVELVSNRLSASKSEAVVFRSKGVVLYSTMPSLITPLKEVQNPTGWLVGTSGLDSLPDHEVSYLESEHTALAAAREMSLSQLVLFAVLFSGLVAAIWLAAKLASQPLDVMLRQVGEIEKTGDLNLRVTQNGPTELQTLAQGFNGMLGKLQETTVSQGMYRASEERLSFAIQGTNDGLWDWDMVTSEVWYSPRYKAMLGYEDEEFPNLLTSFESHVHPDDAGSTWNAVEKHLEESAEYDVEHRLRTKSGSYCWVRARGAVSRDTSGEPIRMSGSMQDITSEKEYEAALKDVSESLRATLDLLGKSDGVLDWKINTQETAYTQGFRKILGFDGDDHEAFPNTLEALHSRIHPDDKDGLWQEVDQSLSGREPFVFEFRVRCKNEKYIWVRSRGSASFDEDGKPVRLVGSIYDISALKDVELERDRFLSTAAELYAAVDLKTLKWVKLSAAWSTTLGYEPEVILELSLPDLHPDEEHEVIVQQVKRLQNGESVKGWVVPTWHQDGSVRYIEWNIDPPIPGDSIVYGAGRDVTKVREYLAQIEETTLKLKELNLQYEQSNNDLAQFAYVASHDLQEPLRAVGGFLQLLQRHCSDQLDETATGYIDKSVSGAARMSQLIHDLLYYSRVANANPDYSSVDLNQCVAHALETLATVIAASGANVKVAELPPVRGIEPLLVQLFQNLIGNAIKYRSEDSPIVEVWSESNESEVVIHVKDNGIGIAEEYQDQVFALFKRLHHRAEYPGTGIGLAICQRVAKRHGGSISVQSRPNEGTCFSVHLDQNIG